jgi:ribosome assembly protein YihI (activator of Der GTPase)
MRAITRYLKGIVGQMPMSIDAVRKAEELIKERDRFASTEWNAIAIMDDDLYILIDREPADEQLQKAIEEFRQRKIDAIDAQLRKLGVDPR